MKISKLTSCIFTNHCEITIYLLFIIVSVVILVVKVWFLISDTGHKNIMSVSVTVIVFFEMRSTM